MDIQKLNCLSEADARQALYHCLSCHRWVDDMLAGMPFGSVMSLNQRAESGFGDLNEQEWLEAFDGHPKIGDVNSLKDKYAATRMMASHEQSSVQHADDEVIMRLAHGNRRYEDKFGFIFIVFATGKSAARMLELLEDRLPNSRDQELKNAAREQMKITRLRLEKLL